MVSVITRIKGPQSDSCLGPTAYTHRQVGSTPSVDAMSPFPCLVSVHALAATVWTGGHLVLDLGVLPQALRERSADRIRDFEPLGLTALGLQVITGLWMGLILLPDLHGLFDPANPIGLLVGTKLLLLTATAALAVHARLRLIPNLTDANLIRLGGVLG